jgi:hypothetical protein
MYVYRDGFRKVMHKNLKVFFGVWLGGTLVLTLVSAIVKAVTRKKHPREKMYKYIISQAKKLQKKIDKLPQEKRVIVNRVIFAADEELQNQHISVKEFYAVCLAAYDAVAKGDKCKEQF